MLVLNVLCWASQTRRGSLEALLHRRRKDTESRGLCLCDRLRKVVAPPSFTRICGHSVKKSPASASSPADGSGGGLGSGTHDLGLRDPSLWRSRLGQRFGGTSCVALDHSRHVARLAVAKAVNTA